MRTHGGIATTHLLSLLTVHSLLLTSSLAQVPEVINYQGRLVDNGTLVNDVVPIVLRLYDTDMGGSPLYADSNMVTVVDGLYSTAMGDNSILGHLPDVLTNVQLWLEVEIDGIALTPREELRAVPYARIAGGVEPGAITLDMMGGGSVDETKINWAMMPGGLVDGDHNTEYVAGEGLALDVVTFSLTNSAVTTARLADAAVTSNKIDWTSLPPGLQDGDDQLVLKGYDENGDYQPGPTAAGTNAIALGRATRAGGDYSVVGGGEGSLTGTGSPHAAIGGGFTNRIFTSAYTTIGGGYSGIVSDSSHTVVGGGLSNSVWFSPSAVVGGGQNNYLLAATNAVIAGGRGNFVNANGAAIVGGYQNYIHSGFGSSFIGGGYDNEISADVSESVIAGGWQNWIGTNTLYSAIGGGRSNFVDALSFSSVISGGERNWVNRQTLFGTIAGGTWNTIGHGSSYGVIGGGVSNWVGSSSRGATVPGGRENRASGDDSFAAGNNALARHRGAFVWADSTGMSFGSTSNDQFLVRAGGGMAINTNDPDGYTLYVAGPMWAQSFAGDGGGLTNLNLGTLPPGSVSSNSIAWATMPAGLQDGDDVGLLAEGDPLALHINGAVPMQGPLDMGGHSIFNVADTSIDFAGGVAFGALDVLAWQEAYGWGDHALAAYVQEGLNGSITVTGTVTAAGFVGDGSMLTNLPDDGDWTVSGTDVYVNVSGNVGIGTSIPSRKLEVAGDIYVDGSLMVSDPDLLLRHAQFGTAGSASGWSPNPDGFSDGLWLEFGVVGSEGAGLYLDDDMAAIFSPGDHDLLRVYDEDVLPAGDPEFIISGVGHVGIGTTNATQRLTVAGTVESTTGGFKFPDGSVQTNALPTGVIVMWSGSAASIPSGWALCNGANGTPNLIDRFILSVGSGENPGATGGNATHTHSVSVPTATSGSMVDLFPGDGIPNFKEHFSVIPNSPISTALVNSDHGHQVTIPTTSTSSQSSHPPYYKLAFIMKL